MRVGVNILLLLTARRIHPTVAQFSPELCDRIYCTSQRGARSSHAAVVRLLFVFTGKLSWGSTVRALTPHVVMFLSGGSLVAQIMVKNLTPMPHIMVKQFDGAPTKSLWNYVNSAKGCMRHLRDHGRRKVSDCQEER